MVFLSNMGWAIVGLGDAGYSGVDRVCTQGREG